MEEWDEAELRFGSRAKTIRTVAVALGVNALVALLFLGGPYVRGRWRAADGQARFARFAACVWGGKPAADPGLGLPEGEQLHYADRVVHGPAAWPRRCKKALEAIRPAPAILLFPKVKQAEDLVARTVEQVEGELDRLARARSGRSSASPVPLALHERIERLMAALSVRATTSGEETDLTAPAIRFDGPASLIEPTRVPLQTAANGWTRMAPRGDGLVAVALDRHRIARVKVGAGGLTLQRVRRPALVRGLVPGPAERPWLVWAMPDTRCGDEPLRCADHATGVARLGRDDTRAPAPTWVAGHPEGPVDRSVSVRAAGQGGHAVDLVARTTEGGAEVRRFTLAPPTVEPGEAAPDETPAPPTLASATWALDGFARGDVAALVGGVAPVAAVWTAVGDDGRHLWLRSLTEGSAPRDLGALAAADAEPTIVTCVASGVSWIVAAAETYGLVVRRRRTGELEEGRPIALRGGAHGTAPALGCGDDTLSLVTAGEDSGLALRTCDPEGCTHPRDLGARGRFVAVTREGDATAVAFASAPDGQIRVLVVADGKAPPAPRTVAPCFGDDGGLCGPPLLASRNGRILLGAREGGDLRVVETTDAGRSWRPMRGLR